MSVVGVPVFVPCRSQWCVARGRSMDSVWVVENEEVSFFYSVLVYGSLGSSACLCLWPFMSAACLLLAVVASVTVRLSVAASTTTLFFIHHHQFVMTFTHTTHPV